MKQYFYKIFFWFQLQYCKYIAQNHNRRIPSIKDSLDRMAKNAASPSYKQKEILWERDKLKIVSRNQEEVIRKYWSQIRVLHSEVESLKEKLKISEKARYFEKSMFNKLIEPIYQKIKGKYNTWLILRNKKETFTYNEAVEIIRKRNY